MTIYSLDILLPNLEPVCCSMSISNCWFLTCIQISQEAGQVIWYSHLLKNLPQSVMIHTSKGFSIVNEAEVDIFMKFSCFFCDSTDVANLISGSSAFSKSSLYIWKFSVHMLLKPNLKDFEHYLASIWNERNCTIVWIFIHPRLFPFLSLAPWAKPSVGTTVGLWEKQRLCCKAAFHRSTPRLSWEVLRKGSVVLWGSEGGRCRATREIQVWAGVQEWLQGSSRCSSSKLRDFPSLPPLALQPQAFQEGTILD